MKVAIAGYGVEGKASFAYWSGLGAEVTVADERSDVADLPASTTTILGEGAFSQLGDYDLIIRSPSLSPEKLPYGDKVWSATNEFFAQCPAPIIGVTGTKGKGTTSSLIAAVLQAAGKTVHLVGNIGVPALEVLSAVQSTDFVVFELSSFQLWDIRKSPHIAVVLGIEPDHLDVHAGMDDYVAAKANIARFQRADDIVVFHRGNELSRSIAEQSAGQQVPYPFDISDVVDSLQIPGPHNVENAAAAIAATRSIVSDTGVIRRGLASFSGLPHRLKLVREVAGVRYYDDNYSSAPAATLAAVRSFDEPEVLIAGGYSRDLDFGDLASGLAQQANLAQVVLIGQTAGAIRDALAQHDFHAVTVVDGDVSMQAIVGRAAQFAQPGGVVIMSPGCPSFDMFKNFTDRGDRFVEAVQAL